MNKKLKKKWINALKNGKFFEAKEYLKSDAWYPVDKDGNAIDQDDPRRRADGYCCLGVLCEIDPEVKEADGKNFVHTNKTILKELNEAWDAVRRDAFYGSVSSYPFHEIYDLNDIEYRHLVFNDNRDIIGLQVGDSEFLKIVQKHYGLDRKVRVEKEDRAIHSKLIGLNDKDGERFPVIARYLEKVVF